MRPALCAVLAGASLVALSCSSRAPSAPAPPTLSVLMGADVTTLDPHASFDEVTSVILVNVFESLVRFDSRFQLAPELATRWFNPDDRTWRFVLDPRARFSDGTPLRASDVRFSLERLRSLSGSQLSGFVRHVQSVEIVDDHTVEIRTETPVAILNGLAFIPIVSEAHVRAAGAQVAERPLGTGPYRLVSWQRGRSIVLEANAHRARLPDVRRVEFMLQPAGVGPADIARLNPHLTLYFRRGKIDEFERQAVPGQRVLLSDSLAVYYAALNTRAAVPAAGGQNPLRDVRVRRALAHALDRELLATGSVRGVHPAGQLLVPQVFGYDPEARPAPTDVEAARRLLREARAEGVTLPLHLEQGGSHVLEKLLASQWERLGLKVPLVEVPAEEYVRRLEGRDFVVALVGYACGSADASELLTFNLHTPDPAKGYGVGNYADFSNAEVDRITEENLRVFDPRLRLRMLQRALRVVGEEVPYLPLVTVQDVYVISDRIRFTPHASSEVRLSEVGWAEGAP